MTRPPTGAAALLALLTCVDGDVAGLLGPMGAAVLRARLSLRNAIRRLVRAHGRRVGPAAAALGVAPSVLRAGALAVGLTLPSEPGRPRRPAV